MEAGNWAALGIFCGIAFILLILLIIRTIFRALNYHDCCGSCRKNRNSGGGSKGAKQTEGIARELQAISDKQRAEAEKEANRESLGRSNSQTFDPLNPDSLVLPIHGIHYPDPGEESEEEAPPPGGHDVDFRIVTVGIDEPDKAPVLSEERQDTLNQPEDKEHESGDDVTSSRLSVPDSNSSQHDTPTDEQPKTNGGVASESHNKGDAGQDSGESKYMNVTIDESKYMNVMIAEVNQPDTPTEKVEELQEKLTNGGVPDSESHSEGGNANATPTQDMRESPEITEEPPLAQGRAKLFATESPDEETGVDNRVEVDDAELRPVYV